MMISRKSVHAHTQVLSIACSVEEWCSLSSLEFISLGTWQSYKSTQYCRPMGESRYVCSRLTTCTKAADKPKTLYLHMRRTLLPFLVYLFVLFTTPCACTDEGTTRAIVRLVRSAL